MKYMTVAILALFLLVTGPAIAAERNSGFGDFFANQTHSALSGEEQTTENFDAVAADQTTAEDAAQIAPAAGDTQADADVETESGIYTAAPIPENAFDGSWQRNPNEFIFGP